MNPSLLGDRATCDECRSENCRAGSERNVGLRERERRSCASEAIYKQRAEIPRARAKATGSAFGRTTRKERHQEQTRGN